MQTDLTLTKKTFEKGMLRLEAAYREKQLTKETLQVYYERLCFWSDKEFSEAINDVLDNERWFPTINGLLKYLPSIKQYINED